MRTFLTSLTLLLALFVVSAAQDSAPKQTPLSEFTQIYSADPAVYGDYQLKFTYLGSQKKIVPSLGAVGTGRTYDGGAFLAFERDLDYSNDDLTLDTLTLPLDDFKSFMDSILAHPDLQDTAFVVEPNASLMILKGSGVSTMCWEHLSNVDETDSLFQFLGASVSDLSLKETIGRYQDQMVGVRP